MAKERIFFVIDARTFYATVECVERGLDPMTAKLVVADPERSDKTICLAVSPAMKALGVKNRCRVFEIPKNIDYIMAPPRMQKYIEYAAEIYGVYLKYIAPEDIFVYSIDECFIDVTAYLTLYSKTPKEFATFLMQEVQEKVGVRTTCGIGTNMYLAKIALDITAKHAKDFIGELTEESFKETLWLHEPLSDFWRIGPGTEAHLKRIGITNMRGITQVDEDLLYKEFGKDAELLIDHAWGREPVTMKDVKAYIPRNNSITQGQVLMRDYGYEEGALIIREMTDQLCLDLVKRNMVTDSITLWLGFSRENRGMLQKSFTGGTVSLDYETSAGDVWRKKVEELYFNLLTPECKIRRVFVNANNIHPYSGEMQISMFSQPVEKLDSEKRLQETVLKIKSRYGKNSLVKGMNFMDGAMTITRNKQIGGHKSGEETTDPDGRI